MIISNENVSSLLAEHSGSSEASLCYALKGTIFNRLFCIFKKRVKYVWKSCRAVICTVTHIDFWNAVRPSEPSQDAIRCPYKYTSDLDLQ